MEPCLEFYLSEPQWACYAGSIPLSQGKTAVVSDEDFDWLMQWKWHARKQRKTFYAARNANGRPVLMHREILKQAGCLDFECVDHVDMDGLNNQRFNLRPATNSQNLANRGLDKNNSSGFKGVSWHSKGRKWQVKIKVRGRTISLGLFPDKIEAALAYDRAARIHFKEFAALNFPNI